jgi:vancomycin resistance protein YoaR
VATRVTQPQVTRENAARLGLTEKMSSFTVNFEPAPYRTKNIGRAVELINGSVVMPDETWSFNRTVGERTEANGFVEGVMILDDQFTKAPGGGVSAVATTMFNAMFFAGVDPVEYGAHSFYIERYPEGREATVAWGSLDLRFANDSGNAIYIQAESTDTSVTVTFLGTKKYDEIESVTGSRTKVKQPEKKVSTDKECVPQTPLEGFDVTVERVFRDGGEEVKREPFRTHYTPRNEIICE